MAPVVRRQNYRPFSNTAATFCAIVLPARARIVQPLRFPTVQSAACVTEKKKKCVKNLTCFFRARVHNNIIVKETFFIFAFDPAIRSHRSHTYIIIIYYCCCYLLPLCSRPAHNADLMWKNARGKKGDNNSSAGALVKSRKLFRSYRKKRKNTNKKPCFANRRV